METIGLIAAMPQERDALLRCIKDWERAAIGSFRGQRFESAGQACLLVTSGMGARRAGAAARSLVERYAPRILISFGIAGAVEADLQIGDVVMAEAVCRLDGGALGPLQALARWPQAAREAAAQALSGLDARLLSGTAITTGGPQIKESLVGHMLHPILEMETAGIAQAAAETGIPLFALRAISDGPRAPMPFDLGEVMDADANLQAGKLLEAVARRPRMVFQFVPMLRNSRTAADNAAIALAAALRQAAF